MEKQYVDLLTKLLEDISKIDGGTLREEKETEWWFQMMTIRRMAQKYLDEYPAFFR